MLQVIFDGCCRLDDDDVYTVGVSQSPEFGMQVSLKGKQINARPRI